MALDLDVYIDECGLGVGMGLKVEKSHLEIV